MVWSHTWVNHLKRRKLKQVMSSFEPYAYVGITLTSILTLSILFVLVRHLLQWTYTKYIIASIWAIWMYVLFWVLLFLGIVPEVTYWLSTAAWYSMIIGITYLQLIRIHVLKYNRQYVSIYLLLLLCVILAIGNVLFSIDRYLPNKEAFGVYAGVFVTFGTTLIELYIYTEYLHLLEGLFENRRKKDRLLKNALFTLGVTILADISLMSLNILMNVGTIFWRPFVYSVRLSSIVYFAMVIKELY